ncbi:TPA: APC family permease [Aeromonas veronii]|nr:APC family permease [Aeromonas veronii]
MNTSQTYLLAVGVGAIIGWGAFVLPEDLFFKSAGPIYTGVALVISAFLISFIGYSYRYILKNTENKSITEAIYFNMGRKHLFSYCWIIITSYSAIISLNITAIGIVYRHFIGIEYSGNYLYTIFDWDIYEYEVLASVCVLLFFSVTNISKSQVSKQLQNIVAGTLCLSIVLLSIMLLSSDSSHLQKIYPVANEGSISGMLSIIAIAPWAFLGFELIPLAAKNSQLSGNRVYGLIVLALVVSACLYYIIAFSLSTIITWTEIQYIDKNWALGFVVQKHLGSIGYIILGIATLSSVLAGVNGFLASASNIVIQLIDFDLSPEKIVSKTSSMANKLRCSVLLITGLSLGSAFIGRNAVLVLVEIASIGIAISFMYICYLALKIAYIKKIRFEVYSIALLIAFGFFTLLFLPFSPSSIRLESFIIFSASSLFGIVSYIFIKRKSSHIGN